MGTKKILSRIILIATIFFILCTIQNTVRAGEFIENGRAFLELGANEPEVIDKTGLKAISDNLLSILMPIGVVVAVVVTAILGLQYMWGSTENKAEIKQALIPWGVSIFVLFSAYTIWSVVVNIMSNAT